MDITLQAGVDVEVDTPPLPALTSTTPADFITAVDVPLTGLELAIPAVAPVIVDVPATDGLVVPVGGPVGGDGPSGPPGPPGPTGNLDEDLPDLTLLFENGLI